MRIDTIIAGLTVLIAALAASPAGAQQGAGDRARSQNVIETAAGAPAAGTGTYGITVCNEHPKPVALALAYKRVEDLGSEDWYYRGWVVIQPDACSYVAETASRYFYHYATELDNAEVIWRGDVDLCVKYPGPYDFTVGREEPECPQGTEIAPFRESFIAPGVSAFQLKLG